MFIVICKGLNSTEGHFIGHLSVFFLSLYITSLLTIIFSLLADTECDKILTKDELLMPGKSRYLDTE